MMRNAIREFLKAHGSAYDAASGESQGRTLGENGVVTLAVEGVSPGSLPVAFDYLKEAYDVESVALVGASAGTGPVLQVAEEDPEEISQIIVLLELAPIGWQLFILGNSPNEQSAVSLAFDAFATRLLARPLSLRFKQEEFCDGDKAHRKTLRDHRFRRLRHHS
jgi:hypothetical protein